MDYDFKFSIIMPAYNVGNYFYESIDSIINQSLDFKENVQLIIVDDSSSDNSLEIALKYQESYPDNILVLSREEGLDSKSDSKDGSNDGSIDSSINSMTETSYDYRDMPICSNIGMEHALGKYINFMEPKDRLSLDTLEMVLKAFDSYDDIDFLSIDIEELEATGTHIPLSEKFTGADRIVDLIEDYKSIQSHISSCFFKHDSITKLRFDESLSRGSGSLFINELLLKNPKYLLLDGPKYYQRRFYPNSPRMDKGFFTDYLNGFSLKLIELSRESHDKVLDFIQYLIVFEFRPLLDIEDLSQYLNPNEQEEFFSLLEHVLSFIDNKNISKNTSIKNYYRTFLRYVKNNREFHIDIKKKKKEIFLKSGNFTINRLHNHQIYIDIVEIKSSHLYISGQFTSSANIDSLVFEGVLNNNGQKEVFVSRNREYVNETRKNKRVLGIYWQYPHHFDLKIPIDEKKNLSIDLRARFSENDESMIFYPNIAFRDFAHISKLANYFVSGNSIVLFRDNKFHVVPYSLSFMLKLELKSIINILKSDEKNKYYNIYIRLLRLILYPFMKNKNIWLFLDRPTVADDNAMHLFKYSIRQDDNIDKYYILDKSSKDFEKMKSISKNIIPFKSFKHKIYYLFASKIVSSHLDHPNLNPYRHDNQKLFNSLTDVKKIYLQHGVIKDDLSDWIRKYYHNFALLITSSDIERDSILNSHYNYDEDVVLTFGFPRFDNLENKGDNKTILFMPSWRKHLNEYNITSSDYYFRLKSFFENKKLLESLKKEGYTIVFKPHFNLLQFLDHFDFDMDLVKIDTTSSYQELFNTSSVMITDYSSVFFDFAYLKKPIIYYQSSDDYHFEEGYFDYETMGFGPVVKSEDELVDSIINYMKNDCIMEDSYKKRVDDFFKYTDRNNCKRVYEWVLKH